MAFRQSETPIMAQALLDALLASLSARPAAALLNAPKVLLFQNDFVVQASTAIGDFTEADFGGYPAGGIVLPAVTGPVEMGNGTRAVLANVTFAADGTLDPAGQTVYGYYVVGNTGADLYMFEKFAEPVTFGVPGDFCDLATILPEPAFRATS